MRSLFVCWVVLLTAVGARAASLDPLKEPLRREKSIVLVAGINDTYEHFRPWFDHLRQQEADVWGFTEDHREHSMTDNATSLAASLERLQADGAKSITVLAHSMGGLVAKKALHLLAQNGVLQGFETVTLTAYGTPWGGNSLSEVATALPGIKFMLKLLSLPMGLEMSPSSAFMASLREPLPSNVNFEVVQSADDSVARPKGSSAVSQYNVILAQTSRVENLQAVSHDGFVANTKPSL